MGDGLKITDTWPYKLRISVDCNVYPFGKNGWTSVEQFEFYDKALKNLEFDYLIVGVVSNDPHLRGNFCGNSYSKDLIKRRHISLRSLGPLRLLKEYSYAIDYVDQIIDGTITPMFRSKGTLSNPPIVSYGYYNWEKDYTKMIFMMNGPKMLSVLH